MKEKIYSLLPHFIQNILISIFNFLMYRKRYKGVYQKSLNYYRVQEGITLADLQEVQRLKYKEFIEYSLLHSPYYRNAFVGINDTTDIKNLRNLPILNKEDLRKNSSDIFTIKEHNAIVSKTGGTTGTSLKVLYTLEDTQERFGILDAFRASAGYKLGKRTAWFSGKELLSEKDVSKNRFWKTDYLYNVRYYSTFHINEKYLSAYIHNLIKFKPEFLVGFPSTIFEIAKHGNRCGIVYPENTVKAIFPTAETVTDEMRSVVESFFHCKMLDQYASSEGAPFITQCIKGNLHLELRSGVYEVLDSKDEQVNEGRLVVTSFNTHGTPLIRYDIGDSIKLSNNICTCGNNNPLVDKIIGRQDDYIYSEKTGKVNLGNISNTLKGVLGIQKFQVVQNSLLILDVYLIIDENEFTIDMKNKFIKNWRDRIGNDIELILHYKSEIPTEKSGKFRLVKNNVKHLLNE